MKRSLIAVLLILMFMAVQAGAYFMAVPNEYHAVHVEFEQWATEEYEKEVMDQYGFLYVSDLPHHYLMVYPDRASRCENAAKDLAAELYEVKDVRQASYVRTTEAVVSRIDMREPVDIDALLSPQQGDMTLALFTAEVEISDRIAIYDMIPEGDSELLEQNLGVSLYDNSEWYLAAGHRDLQYLIRKADGGYSLWEFNCFTGEEYPYSEVLDIYDIHSPSDIKEVIVNPANMDNTAAGMQLQREIGTVSITDKEDIATLYGIVSGMTCYGWNNWELIDMGDASEDGMLNRVRQGRYLTFVTADGREIDQLKYTGVSGTFYEYGGVAYSPLTAEEKAAVEAVLEIE